MHYEKFVTPLSRPVARLADYRGGGSFSRGGSNDMKEDVKRGDVVRISGGDYLSRGRRPLPPLGGPAPECQERRGVNNQHNVSYIL